MHDPDNEPAQLQDCYQSFLVRIWQDQQGDASLTPWRIQVQSIQTGKTWALEDLGLLLDLFVNLTQK
ncbi:MAG TPA: hypothetical protein VMN57_08495 [Anaerolineales bacterium]|nr:hypothetical protein [Anaerolineales bacterium]